MSRVYTKTGDKGTTGIWGGQRVEKDDVRIEAVGTIDELNAMLGVVRSFMSDDDSRQQRLFRIQTDLMAAMSLVGTPAELRANNQNALSDHVVEDCEEWMDEMMDEMQENGYFVLPGGTPVSAHLHLARTIARRAERRLHTLHRTDAVPEEVKRLINRLSDLFFVMARYDLHLNHFTEEKWKLFVYKSKSKRNG